MPEENSIVVTYSSQRFVTAYRLLVYIVNNMGFFDAISDFVSNNKVATVAGIAAVGLACYYIVQDEDDQIQVSRDTEDIVPKSPEIDSKLNALKLRFNKNNPDDLKELICFLQAAIQEETNTLQNDFREKRRAAKGKGIAKYFDVINDGLNALGEASSAVQNKIFGQVNLTESEFQTICQSNPSIIAMLYQSQAQLPGKLLTLTATKAILEVQRLYLQDPKLIADLRQATAELPQEAMMQLPVYLAIMLADHTEEQSGQNENTINKSIMTHQASIMKDLQQQQMLIERVVTQVMSSMMPPGMGGFGQGGYSGTRQEFMNQSGNVAHLSSMMGLDPEALNAAMMSGDNEMMAQLMQNMGVGNR